MLSIAAILKNEQPYILEWLAYHMVLGIEDFYIADNISSDGGSELLYQLDKANFITRIEHPTKNNEPPQLSAYSKVLSMLEQNKWVAFIDADEFIYPNNFEHGLDRINHLFEDESNGAISLNWAVYGSSHSILPDNGLVIERFIKRATEEHPVNKHYKSIVRVGDVISTGLTPHAFKIKPGKKFVMPNGKIQEKNEGISDITDWSEIRLNHYVIKSKAEFFNKKASRGRATTMNEGLSRNIAFFNHHDLNEVDQSIPLWFLKKVKDKINDIKNELVNYGYQTVPERNKTALYRTSDNYGKGVIDSLKKENHQLTVNGWAVNSTKAALYNIAIVINNEVLLYPTNTVLHDRPDVQKAGISDSAKCGFQSYITLPDITITDIKIYATDKNGLVCTELNLGDHFTKLFI